MQQWIRNLVFWTWCFPQTLLGFIVFCVVKYRGAIIEIENYRGVTLVRTTNSKLMGGMALGKYNFVIDKQWKTAAQTIEHEYGHTAQGYILGPLYIIIIGIPSEFWLLLSHISPYIKKTYRTRFPENWADTLGGVK
jgi:hypothetical protein